MGINNRTENYMACEYAFYNCTDVIQYCFSMSSVLTNHSIIQFLLIPLHYTAFIMQNILFIMSAWAGRRQLTFSSYVCK